MFNDSKYTRWYYLIIDRAVKQVKSGYTERHHILPKSLGGANANENMVNLTFREHFICHKLLVKMTIGQERFKMIHALWRMTTDTKTNRLNTSAQYEQSRKLFKVMMQEKRAGKPVVPVGYKFSKERNDKIAKALTGKKRKPFTAEHLANMSSAMQGKIFSTARNEKISVAHLGRKFTEDHKLKISIANTGLIRTAEQKQRMSLAQAGKIRTARSEETKLKQSVAAKLRWAKSRELQTL